MAGPEQRAESMRRALEAAVNRIEKSTLRPMQKEAFLCQARCCDSAEDLNLCCNRCQGQVTAAEQLVNQQMAQFQERLQRCARRCQDTVQEKLDPSPSQQQIGALQMELANCMADCAGTYEKQIPKLERDLMQSLQRTNI
ncbi:hypothetical protein WJX74_002993 [Apatococcus lobatus]|uniref:Protein FAM136A n=1 Tax=Apatococcus lobatus TaxID=904363 RepID=A0AAW1S4T6_9CHLO